MAIIQAKRDTRLKLRNADSKHLKPTEYFEIKAGSNLGCDILSVEGKTAKIRLAGNAGLLKAGEEWYLFAPDWDLGKDTIVSFTTSKQSKSKLVNGVIQGVPYFAQVDSRSDGYRYCFSHAIAMMIAALQPDYIEWAKKNGYTQPENYYISKLAAYGDTTNNAAHIRCLKNEFNIDAYFSMQISPSDLKSAIDLGVPVPIGVAYKASGHWVLVKGYRNGGYVINDPYGSRDGSNDYYPVIASDQGKQGENEIYSQSVMNRIFWDGASADCGWAVIVTAVDGKPTGVKAGM